MLLSWIEAKALTDDGLLNQTKYGKTTGKKGVSERLGFESAPSFILKSRRIDELIKRRDQSRSLLSTTVCSISAQLLTLLEWHHKSGLYSQ
jgi:hypothetical protein